jgi:hypothetical protein
VDLRGSKGTTTTPLDGGASNPLVGARTGEGNDGGTAILRHHRRQLLLVLLCAAQMDKEETRGSK